MAAPPPTPVERFIHEVQGDGPSSPLLGEAVTIQGVVVGDLQEANELNGFFVQEETTDEEGNPATSEGIFVYCGADGADCADVAIGNLVTVSGNVDESNGQTQLGNDTGILEVVVQDTGNLLGLRTPATVDSPWVSSPSSRPSRE